MKTIPMTFNTKCQRCGKEKIYTNYYYIDTYEEEVERLNNIIEELEKFIQKELENNIDGEKSFGGYQCKIILDKLQELKERK